MLLDLTLQQQSGHKTSADSPARDHVHQTWLSPPHVAATSHRKTKAGWKLTFCYTSYLHVDIHSAI